PAVTEADLLGISFAFGFIITALVYAIGKVSGCHINPAVTFALAATKRFPWREVPTYWAAQYVGAIIGAFAIWGVFGQNAVTFGMGQTHFAADASTTYYLQAALAEAVGTGSLLRTKESKMAIETNQMRKFLNEPAQVVKESLAGLAAAHHDLLRYEAAAQIIVRKDAPKKGKVALISGGGSGHEPLHGGFVGLGMLDAACPGEVFTSPVPAQMLAATKAVDGGAGVVHIVKNYTGDVLNF